MSANRSTLPKRGIFSFCVNSSANSSQSTLSVLLVTKKYSKVSSSWAFITSEVLPMRLRPVSTVNCAALCDRDLISRSLLISYSLSKNFIIRILLPKPTVRNCQFRMQRYIFFLTYKKFFNCNYPSHCPCLKRWRGVCSPHPTLRSTLLGLYGVNRISCLRHASRHPQAEPAHPLRAAPPLTYLTLLIP